MTEKKIAANSPRIASLLNESMLLGLYSRKLYQLETEPSSPRQSLVKQEVRRYLKHCFSSEEIQHGNIDWDGDWVINIFDHHVPLNHPFILGANIVAQLWQLPARAPKGIIVLADSGVPWNNIVFPRGFKFEAHQLNIISDHSKHKLAYANEPIASLALLPHARQQGVRPDAYPFLESVEQTLNSAVAFPGIQGCLHQVSRINYALWPQLFEASLRSQVPDLFYVPNEEVCANILQDLLLDTGNIFYRMICEAEIRDLFLDKFRGIAGCWDLSHGHGTHFFWGIDDNGAGLKLTVDGQYLVNRDKGVRLKLEANKIRHALRSRTIYPDMFLAYGVNLFYCGIKPMVGFCSLDYLHEMQGVWVEVMSAIDKAEADYIQGMNVSRMIGGPIVTWEQQENFTQELYALDVLYRGGLSQEDLDRLRNRPFKEALKLAMEAIYKIIGGAP